MFGKSNCNSHLLFVFFIFSFIVSSVYQVSFADSPQGFHLTTENNKLELPEVLSLIGTNLQVAQIPLVAILDNGAVALIKQESYPQKTMSEVGYFNPTFEFQFREGSKLPIEEINQILIGEIGQYDNSSEALNSSYIFKNIKFGEETVLELENDGFTYMIIEAKFANNISGVYATAFENTHRFGDSMDPTYRAEMRERNESVGRTVLSSSKVEITPGDNFLLISQSVICHLSLSYGFQVCEDQNNML